MKNFFKNLWAKIKAFLDLDEDVDSTTAQPTSPVEVVPVVATPQSPGIVPEPAPVTPTRNPTPTENMLGVRPGDLEKPIPGQNPASGSGSAVHQPSDTFDVYAPVWKPVSTGAHETKTFYCTTPDGYVGQFYFQATPISGTGPGLTVGLVASLNGQVVGQTSGNVNGTVGLTIPVVGSAKYALAVTANEAGNYSLSLNVAPKA